MMIAFSMLTACQHDPDPVIYVEQPEHFPAVTYTLDNNPISYQGFELGRMLFYDPVLSKDSTVACASCHQQAVAFADPVHRFSIGIAEQKGTRNAPPIFNLAFRKFFFWDGGVNHLDFIPLNPVANPIEMGESIPAVIKKLQRHPFYPQKFKNTFDTDSIYTQKILYALSQFMASMVSSTSRYDNYIAGKEALTVDELEGMDLFQKNCSLCHPAPLFTNDRFSNNGLDSDFKDTGRQRITEDPADGGKFHIPSLRNIELTAPYMHDGRYQTLHQVIDHYSQSVTFSSTLDAYFLDSNGNVTGIAFTETEKTKLIAFLKTLTDEPFTQDVRFSNPFIKRN